MAKIAVKKKVVKRVNTNEEVIVEKKVVKKNTLEEQAVKNTSASKGTKAKAQPIKEGTPLNHSDVHNINKSDRTVGVNMGLTKNMGDFESLRVDCWVTDTILEGETQSEALARVGDIVYTELVRQVEDLI